MATLDMPANKTDTKSEKNKVKEPDIYNVGCLTTDFLGDKNNFACISIVAIEEISSTSRQVAYLNLSLRVTCIRLQYFLLIRSNNWQEHYHLKIPLN